MTGKPRQPVQPSTGPRRQPGADQGALPRRASLEPFVLPPYLSAIAMQLQEAWHMPGLLLNVSFRCNPRLRTTIARWVLKKNRIELGPRFFTLRQSQPRILCHELAHKVAIALHGRRVLPHGPEWRALIEAAGFSPETQLKTHRRTGVPKPRTAIVRRYEHRCPVCQAVRVSKRPVRLWRCVECAGSGLPGRLLILEVQPKRRLP
jgi:predicted SprT family Zn-dependent metalloprotease